MAMNMELERALLHHLHVHVQAYATDAIQATDESAFDANSTHADMDYE